MARFPCSRCNRVYRGPQQTAYPAVVTKASTYSSKLRLCPDCFRAVVDNPAWDNVVDVPMGVGQPCGRCDKPETPVAIFCTYYATGQERVDLYGRLCNGDCPLLFLEAVWGTVDAAQVALKVG